VIVDNDGAVTGNGCNACRLVDIPVGTNPAPYTGALATVRAASAGTVKLDILGCNLLVPAMLIMVLSRAVLVSVRRGGFRLDSVDMMVNVFNIFLLRITITSANAHSIFD
jgi:hypothetical protein